MNMSLYTCSSPRSFQTIQEYGHARFGKGIKGWKHAAKFLEDDGRQKAEKQGILPYHNRMISAFSYEVNLFIASGYQLSQPNQEEDAGVKERKRTIATKKTVLCYVLNEIHCN